MELMKNGLSTTAVNRISNALSQVVTNFDHYTFKAECLNNLETLELKQRVNHIITVLHQYLPNNFVKASEILCAIKPVWDYGKKEDNLSSFAAWPLVDYIAIYGIDFPEVALNTMKELTSLFSAEFAIRPFISKHPTICFNLFTKWITDSDEDIRRLVSEGTRPKLPWGIQLKQLVKDPSPSIPLLSKLKNDPSLYVRRSVANHLNDIAKDHPELVINTCKTWLQQPTSEIKWLIKHATRTLVKEGNKEVFAILGYTQNPKININGLALSGADIQLGKAISFNFTIKSLTDTHQIIVVDYALHFMKANGNQKAKVFKLKNQSLEPHQAVILTKSFSFKEITTRKYYVGAHKIDILVNGISYATAEFNLTS